MSLRLSINTLLAPNDSAVVTWMVLKLCRVKKSKGGSKEERTPSVKSAGYPGSGLNVSIATASAIECVIDEEKPSQNSPKPSSRNEPERSSVESVSSSSGSSEGKGRTEIHVKISEDKNVIDLKQREVIKKQMSERKKSASEKLSNRNAAKQKVFHEDDSVRRSAKNGEKVPVKEEKRPLPSVSKSRTPRTEVCASLTWDVV